MPVLSRFALTQGAQQQQQNNQLLVRLLLRRHLFSATSIEKPAPARVQLKPPPGEKGVMSYERLYSRCNRYAPQTGHAYDTPRRFFSKSISTCWELWPLFGALSFWVVIACTIVYWSSSKMEVHLNRNDGRITQDWERVANSYWKYPTRLYDPSGKMNSRLPIMETLQDEMLEAARERGTRPKA